MNIKIAQNVARNHMILANTILVQSSIATKNINATACAMKPADSMYVLRTMILSVAAALKLKSALKLLILKIWKTTVNINWLLKLTLEYLCSPILHEGSF